MPEPAKPAGKGMGRKVAGLPLWVWIVAGVGGLMLGLYLRNRGGGTAQQPAADQTGDGSVLGAGASPTDNGLGSSTVDLQGFLDALGQSQTQFMSDLASQIESVQAAQNSDAGLMPGYTWTDTQPKTPVSVQPLATATPLKPKTTTSFLTLFRRAGGHPSTAKATAPNFGGNLIKHV